MAENAFEQFGISDEVLQAIGDKGFTQPTEIQILAIPPLLDWRDLIAKAPTGTGKTYAFGIPIIEQVDPSDKNIQALILAPTRELALQINADIIDLCKYLPKIKTVCLYGGQQIGRQFQALKKKPQIVVATPGRLLDHLSRRSLSLKNVNTVVLDEADRMLDMGFFKDVTRILDRTYNRVNLALLSATLSTDVMTVGWKYQRDAVEILVAPEVESKPDISQYSIELTELQKPRAIMKIMKDENFERAIVFCNTKNKVDRVTKMLKYRGESADCIHGDIRQSQREKVLAAFRRGRIRVLVATDVAARGLDIDDVDVVFNCDVPDENEHYVHRIGRTGRAQRSGVAYSFVTTIMDSIRLQEIATRAKYEIEKITIDLKDK
ncbi:MAG: DEAD/DEAH box helicase [Clostridiales bacterium]|nr:DEAD/DEAH box helicase [Clostridiales bacterium]